MPSMWITFSDNRNLLTALAVIMFLFSDMSLRSVRSSPQENSTPSQPSGSIESQSDAPEIAERDLRDLNSYFPFRPPEDLESWNLRRAELKQHLWVALGLFPKPEPTPLKPVIHGLIDQGEYTIEKVYFQSYPGFYVTGNLYKPKQIQGKVPGILCPHGHHRDGRFRSASEQEIDQQISIGAETFRSNAKSILQARCANLAKMGNVVFHYDMLGYADSQQFSYDLAHGFSKQRPAMSKAQQWGLFSPQAESRLQSVMGLQTWNSIRSLDFLESLPEVDSQRLGITGASGGGTQTFVLAALDDRPAVAFPAVMVSTAMQGGCTCENCSYLRIGTGNVEIAALFAPKPMGLTAADDWTKEMATKGFPQLQALYGLYQKPDFVQLTSRTEFEHNYNQVGREAMYRWFKQHLKFSGEPVETEIEFVDPQRLSVFDDQHPRPAGGPEFEQQLLRELATQSDRQIRERLMGEASKFEDFDSQIGTFVDVVRQTAIESVGEISLKNQSATPAGFEGHPETRYQLADRNGPGLSLRTIQSEKKGKSVGKSVGETSDLNHQRHPAVLLISQAGDSPLSIDAESTDVARELLDAGVDVSIFRDEFISEAQRRESRRVNNSREALGYTIGYNAPQLAIRAHAWASVSKLMDAKNQIVVAIDRSALEVAFNSQQLREQENVAGLVLDTGRFRFQDIEEIRSPDLLPGATKYGELPGLISLSAPKPLLLVGEDEQTADLVVQAYRLSGHPKNLTILKSWPEGRTKTDVILEWMKDLDLN